MSTYVAWVHDPHLSAVTTERTGGPWWMAYAKNWMARRRNRHEALLQKSASIPNALPPDRLGDGQKRLHLPM